MFTTCFLQMYDLDAVLAVLHQWVVQRLLLVHHLLLGRQNLLRHGVVSGTHGLGVWKQMEELEMCSQIIVDSVNSPYTLYTANLYNNFTLHTILITNEVSNIIVDIIAIISLLRLCQVDYPSLCRVLDGKTVGHATCDSPRMWVP